MTKLPELFDLSGKAALVTGGAGLLGREFCRTLADAGAHVVVADIDAAAAKETADEISSAGSSAIGLSLDVADKSSVASALESILKTYSALDILVNSAAIDPKFDPEHQRQHSGDFESYPLEAWNHALEVNLTGVFLCSQAAAAHMLTQGSGVIVNICSIYGIVGPDQSIYQQENQPAQYKPVQYSVTKAGVLGLTKYLAVYYAKKNIRVNALTPGGVDNQHNDEFLEAYSARTVLGRMAEKDEMNGALLFLASDASSYMTGANLVVDGGWTAW